MYKIAYVFNCVLKKWIKYKHFRVTCVLYFEILKFSINHSFWQQLPFVIKLNIHDSTHLPTHDKHQHFIIRRKSRQSRFLPNDLLNASMHPPT